jgi:hypothetical protein
MTDAATVAIESWPLPSSNNMLAAVLAEKQRIGSESTFVCGRVESPMAGATSPRLVLTWMGDSRLRLWSPVGERTAALGDTFHTRERWSTRLGPVCGTPHVYVAPLRDDDGQLTVAHLLAYSDGLQALDGISQSPADESLACIIQKARRAATNDDMSLVEVWLRQPWAQPLSN